MNFLVPKLIMVEGARRAEALATGTAEKASRIRRPRDLAEVFVLGEWAASTARGRGPELVGAASD